MDDRSYVEISIMLDGHEHGLRYWPAVPCVGELIDLRINQVVQCAEVKHVLWRHQSLEEFGRAECKVMIFVELSQFDPFLKQTS